MAAPGDTTSGTAKHFAAGSRWNRTWHWDRLSRFQTCGKPWARNFVCCNIMKRKHLNSKSLLIQLFKIFTAMKKSERSSPSSQQPAINSLSRVCSIQFNHHIQLLTLFCHLRVRLPTKPSNKDTGLRISYFHHVWWKWLCSTIYNFLYSSPTAQSPSTISCVSYVILAHVPKQAYAISFLSV
jgi:hypothetical protein